MAQIMKQLEYLSKEEILKRFVSLEFNRFLDYYKDAEDLNYHERNERGSRERGERGDRAERGDRNDRGERGAKSGKRIRLKINVGEREGINAKRFLGIINEVTKDKSISIGAIEVTNKFTFFDVFADQADKVVAAFANEPDYIVAEAKGSKAADSGKSKPEYRARRSGGNDRSEGRDYREKREGGSRPRRDDSRQGGEKPWRNRSRR
jgi:ATP-dependent RNA helicase DeaD